MNINDLLEGGYAKKPYLPIGKQFVCGKERVIYKRNVNNDSSKVYMRHNAKYIQVVNFEKEMIAKGKWKLPTPVKQSKDVKPCKADQYRNPATGRCVKIKPVKTDKTAKDPAKPVKDPAKPVKDPAKPVKPVKPVKTAKTDKTDKTDVKPQNNTISKVIIGMLTNKNITFTGIRDKNLEAVIEANGGKVFSTVSKKVDLLIAKDINANSASIIKAKQLNIDIIQYDKLMQH
jgi:NAD-dependent DNA ligase